MAKKISNKNKLKRKLETGEGETAMEKLTLNELKQRKNWEKAVIVFKKESFDKEFSKEERSYEVNSKENYFTTGKISNSLYGSCLDGKDSGVRLDIYIYDENNPWLIDYCYITK